jgi:hypothetical protein
MIAGRAKANLTIIIKRIKNPTKPIIAAIATEMEPMMNMMAKNKPNEATIKKLSKR